MADPRGVLRPGSPGPADEASTVVVCGFVACDTKPFNPLVEAVPHQLHLRTGELGSWTVQLLDQAVAESRERPAHGWCVEELGREVGLSRSALHERFVEPTGQTPMHCLAQWRMPLGSGLLRQGQAKIAAIAQEVGYESEAAFTRAFKRLKGQPPAAWRRSQGG